jgi:hypothetical protein
MRAVYTQDEAKDRTPGLRAVRALLKRSPERFITLLARLEEADLTGPGKARPVEAPARDEEPELRDEGLERSLAMCEQVLQRFIEQAKELSAPAGPAGQGTAGGQPPLTPAGPPPP